MNSTALKVGAVITLLLAVVLAIVGARVARQYAQQAEDAQAQAQQQPAMAQTLAVVAVTPLAAYQPIAANSVALVPVHTRPKNYFTTVDDVVGRVPLVDVDTGAQIHQYIDDIARAYETTHRNHVIHFQGDRLVV